MQVDVVDRYDAFVGLRPEWDAVYAADPEAHLFVSWRWFEKWLRLSEDGWFVLVARAGAAPAPPVAFFPLRIVDRRWDDGRFYNAIEPGCGFADCTGLVCRPEHEAAALAAFAAHLARQRWAQLDLDRMRLSDARLALLLPGLRLEGTETEIAERIVQSGVDIAVCPYAELPESWEAYVAARPSANTRQKIRRCLKRIEGDPAYRISHADAATVGRDIEILLGLWAAKWGGRKSRRLDAILNTARHMLTHCFARDALLLPVLWKEERPLAALAILKDAPKRALRFWIGGRDEAWREVAPAFALHAHGIRRAIAEGYLIYDFLSGDEPYKYAFATAEDRLKRLRVTTADRRNRGGALLPRSLPFVFERSFERHRQGRLDEAEIGYRQMLEVDPRAGDALYGLGQIQAARGEHADAVETFRAYVSVRAGSDKGWLRLGRSLAALGDQEAAAAAYRRALALAPGDAAAAAALAALERP